MRFPKIITILLASAGFLSATAFVSKPGPVKTIKNFTEKNVVYKVTYDAKSGKLSATEKLELGMDLVLRNSAGKITEVNKSAIESQMTMAIRLNQSLTSGPRFSGTTLLALVSVFSADSRIMAGSDDQLLEYLRLSFESYSRQSFNGSDYKISGKDWNCGGETCNAQVPAGIEVFVWEAQ